MQHLVIEQITQLNILVNQLTKVEHKYQITEFSRRGGGSLNPKQLSNLNVDLLAANITDSGKESTVKDYINNIAYSGRGDSKEYSYVNDDLNGGIDFYNAEGKRVQIKDNQFVEATEQTQRYDNQSFLEDYGYSFKLYE